MSSEERGDTRIIVTQQVMPSWLDYNGHMTEGRYLLACTEVSDTLLRRVGAGLDYVAAGHSYYTAETHIMHRAESKVGDMLTGDALILGYDEKRLHIFVTLSVGETVAATVEQLLLHVDAKAGRVVPAAPEVLAAIEVLARDHAQRARPDTAGRYVGQGRPLPGA